MLDLFALGDFLRSYKKLDNNLGSNRKYSHKKSGMFTFFLTLFLILAGIVLYYLPIYRCYVAVGDWRLCHDYSSERIIDARESSKELPSYHRAYRKYNNANHP